MASSSSALPTLGAPTSEKLTHENFLLWKTQVMPAIRGARLTCILNTTEAAPAMTMQITGTDGKVEVTSNSEYEKWLQQDQMLLSCIVNFLWKDVLAQVATKTSSASVWATLQAMYPTQTHARVTNLLMQLSSTKKGDMTAAAYITKMRQIGDELAAASKVIDDDQMVSHILSGLDIDYNPLVSSVMGRVDPMPLSDLYAQILAYDTRLDMLKENYKSGFQSSANVDGP